MRIPSGDARLIECVVFTDPQGRELFNLRKKLFKISKSFHGVGPDGNDLFEVKGHLSREI